MLRPGNGLEFQSIVVFFLSIFQNPLYRLILWKSDFLRISFFLCSILFFCPAPNFQILKTPNPRTFRFFFFAREKDTFPKAKAKETFLMAILLTANWHWIVAIVFDPLETVFVGIEPILLILWVQSRLLFSLRGRLRRPLFLWSRLRRLLLLRGPPPAAIDPLILREPPPAAVDPLILWSFER